MSSITTIKAVAFDFGGTLDIPGVHWFDFFRSRFEEYFTHIRPVTKEQYWEAYVYGERRMEKYGIPRDTSFPDTIARKLAYQFEYICKEKPEEDNDENREEFIKVFTATGMSLITDNLKTAAKLIGALHRKYDLSIVSNYYGNLETILKDAGIFPYLDRLLDSTIAGIRKPDAAIWKLALDQSGCKPEEFLIVGDSMKNDILPAQSLGCPTVLVTKELPPGEYTGDWVSSLDGLGAFFNVEWHT